MQLIMVQPKESISFGCIIVRALLFMYVLGSSAILYAQNTPQPTDKDYLIDVHKLPKPISPIQPIGNLAKKIDYRPKFIKVNYKMTLPISLIPMQMKKASPSKIYGNYIKMGVGNYLTSYAEAFFNTKRSEKYAYSLHIRHLDSRIGVIDRQNSGNNQNEAFFNFRSYSPKGVFSGNIGFQIYQWHFYGYRNFRVTPPPAESIRQNFNLVNIKLGYTNKYVKTSKHSYDANVGFYHFIDRYAAKEQELEANFLGKTSLNHANRLYFNTEFSTSIRTDKLGSLQRNLLLSEVYHQYSDSKINFQIGGKIAIQNDTLKNFKQVHLYPKLHFSLNMFKNKFNIYTNLEGGVQKRLLRNMIAENPFLSANIPLLHTNKALEATFGVQTQLLGSFNWQASASYGRYQNLHFFVNNPFIPSQFTLEYELATIPVFNLKNEIILKFKKLSTKLTTELTDYQLSKVAKAWHRPLLTNTLSMHYQAKKVAFDLDFYQLSGIAVFDIVKDEVKDLQAITDLNLKIDYTISPKWLVFLKGNNLLAQQYQRYQYYEVRTTQIIAGAGFTF